MTQQIIVYLLLACALAYLGFKFLKPKKKDKNCENCE
ncbi:MAG: FeoB-associated Cys-rich membrane protein [Bacteroidetes bacterium]|nr:FeoB-associated Cys-rich membrane protein [Bacteroidota bacterium]